MASRTRESLVRQLAESLLIDATPEQCIPSFCFPVVLCHHHSRD